MSVFVFKFNFVISFWFGFGGKFCVVLCLDFFLLVMLVVEVLDVVKVNIYMRKVRFREGIVRFVVIVCVRCVKV